MFSWFSRCVDYEFMNGPLEVSFAKSSPRLPDLRKFISYFNAANTTKVVVLENLLSENNCAFALLNF